MDSVLDRRSGNIDERITGAKKEGVTGHHIMSADWIQGDTTDCIDRRNASKPIGNQRHCVKCRWRALNLNDLRFASSCSAGHYQFLLRELSWGYIENDVLSTPQKVI